MVTVVPRAEIGYQPARPGGLPIEPELIEFVTVHYTGGPIARHYTGDVVAGDKALMRSIQLSHMADPTMSDIGYNIGFGRSGLVFEGRGLDRRNAANGSAGFQSSRLRRRFPADATGSNRWTVSVIFAVGTDGVYADLSPAQREALPDLFEWLLGRFPAISRLDLDGPVIGHRDVRATACPGALWPQIPAWNAALRVPLVEIHPPIPEEDDVQLVMWKHPQHANVWLLGAGAATHLSPLLMAHYTGLGVPLIVEAHAQTLKACLFQSGLADRDLVEA